MVDVHSPDIRSKNMRAIKSGNTKPEIQVRKALHSRGFRYRLGGSGLPGRPDLVLAKYKSVIFVHGCFWHGHDCRFFKVPATRTEFWLDKIHANQKRDRHVIETLQALDWNVIVVWECNLKPSGMGVEAVTDEISVLLKNARTDGGIQRKA